MFVFSLLVHDLFDLLWKLWNCQVDLSIIVICIILLLLWFLLQRHSLIDVVLIVINFNLICIRCLALITLVHKNVGSLLIGRENESVVHGEWLWVLDDFSQVIGALHVTLAAVVVVANMRNLFVCSVVVVILSLLEIIHVLIVFIVRVDVVRVLFCNLENDLILLLQVLVVGINEHELVIIGHVVVLIYLLALVNNVELHLLFLDDELRVLVNQEWRQGVVSLLARHVRV